MKGVTSYATWNYNPAKGKKTAFRNCYVVIRQNFVVLVKFRVETRTMHLIDHYFLTFKNTTNSLSFPANFRQTLKLLLYNSFRIYLINLELKRKEKFLTKKKSTSSLIIRCILLCSQCVFSCCVLKTIW